LQGKGTNETWEVLKGRIHATIENNVPWKEINGRGRPVWMTKEVMAAIRRKKRLWKKTKGKTVTPEYREADKRAKNLIRKAKRRFEKRLADGKGGNSRPFFSYIKRKTKSRVTVGPLKNKQKETVTDDEGMAEVLNEFFSSVFTREDRANLPRAKEMDTEEMRGVRFTQAKVRKKIQKLRTAAAAGPDGIGPRILQELENELVDGLTIVFRTSFAESVIPADWKDANVTPIFKKGTKWDPGNYRPVSLTSICCKVMESIIRDDLVAHLDANGLINPSQHGFMHGKSCCSNLLEFFEKVTSVVDEGKPMDVIFLDFAKAFDKVPRERLLEKVRAHGVRGRALDWIRAWLTGRRQRVVLNGKHSSWMEVLSGVPQGSVLGPILFLIFINDLDAEVRMIEVVKKFADDTKIGKTVQSEEDKLELQRAIDSLTEWAEKWGMAFNVAKCKIMHFGHENPGFEYTMSGQKLDTTEEERDIGVMVTKNLRPSAQCAKAARTATTVLSQLRRAFHFRDRHIFVRLYTQYVRPHLEFASPAWSPWTQTDKECLERVQKKAIRMVSGLESGNYEERLRELGLTTLEERRHRLDMAQTFKIVRRKENVERETWFKMACEGARATRQAADPGNIRPGTARLEVRRNFFSQRVVTDWNRIPPEIKMSNSVESFKKRYAAVRDRVV
jgi:hypothetical protein